MESILAGAGVPADRLETVVDVLLYYGFVGIKFNTEPPKFIFDVGYDMRILKVIASKHADSVTYTLNPAFHPGLNL